jgi:hypothetical protein
MKGEETLERKRFPSLVLVVFGACSSSALSSNSSPELEKGRGKKRKGPLKSSSGGL